MNLLNTELSKHGNWSIEVPSPAAPRRLSQLSLHHHQQEISIATKGPNTITDDHRVSLPHRLEAHLPEDGDNSSPGHVASSEREQQQLLANHEEVLRVINKQMSIDYEEIVKHTKLHSEHHTSAEPQATVYTRSAGEDDFNMEIIMNGELFHVNLALKGPQKSDVLLEARDYTNR
jgi:hypothetical protein